MGVGIEQLDKAIDAVLALDVDTLTAGERQNLAVALTRAGHRLGAARARVVEAWAAAGGWSSNGARSPSVRLAREANCSVGTAKVELARARQLRSMPKTAAALGDGDISFDHVRLLGLANRPTRAAAFTRDEEMLVGFCRKLTFEGAQRAVDYWCQRVDADTVEDDAADVLERNSFHAGTSFQGRVLLQGELDPVGGGIVQNELERLAADLKRGDKAAGITRTRSQRMAAALVQMAERSAALPEGAKPAKILLRVTIGDRSLARLCELGDGTVIAPGQLVPYLGRADIETILFSGPSTIISVSHRRTFIGALREAIIARDRHCQHPSGCDVPGDHCDVDHLVPWSEGGPTSQFNAELRCPAHNRIPRLRGTVRPPRPYREITRRDERLARKRLHMVRHRRDGPDGDDDPDAKLGA